MIRLLIVAISVAIGAAAVGLLFMIAGLPTSTIGWIWAAMAFALGFLIARACLSLGLNTSAALEQGAREAALEARGDTYEATGRRAGAVVGKGLNRVARIGAPKPAASPAPSTDPSPTPGAQAPNAAPEVTVDRAARVIGSMVGRRTAARRNRP